MKRIFLILLLWIQPAMAQLVGTWKLARYIYDGESLPLPNPDLDLRFVFLENKISVLHWFRHGEEGFCERRATYDTEKAVLHQKTFWLNPRNDDSCFSDPEMQMNSETFTPFHMDGKNLYLELTLDDKSFIYVFDLLPDEIFLRNR